MRINQKHLTILCGAAALLLLGALLFFVLVLTVSGGMKDVTQPYIVTPDTLPEGTFDCVLILGAGLKSDGTPSDMLHDRVSIGTQAYLSDPGRFGVLLMSGDRTGDYDEPDAMKSLAVSLGADEKTVFCDYEGYSTYESILRVRDVYGAKRVLIVTQEYHLYRAVYTARALGMDACGLSADTRRYRKELYRNTREALARYKDFMKSERDGTLSADTPHIDLHGDGDAS